MVMNNRKIDNARRLSYALAQRAEDPEVISALANLLNYLPEQLQQDMSDLDDVLCGALKSMEEEKL